MSLLLVKIIKSGDIESIRTMVKNKMNVNQRGPTDFRLVDFALGYDQLDIFELLLEAGANAERVYQDGQNILHRAIGLGKLEFVSVLLAGGYVNINFTDLEGNTPLHAAVSANDNRMVEFIMSKQFESELKVNTKNSYGKTALELAASFPYNDIVVSIASELSGINKMLLNKDDNLEVLLNTASLKIQELTSVNVKASVLEAEIDRLNVMVTNLEKSIRLKNTMIERNTRKSTELKESVLRERIENERMTIHMEKMQKELDLRGEIDTISQELINIK